MDAILERSDLFLSLPLESQAIYFHLVNSTNEGGNTYIGKAVLRMIGARQEDFQRLVDSKLVVIKKGSMYVVRTLGEYRKNG